jgi:hypothetical protein
VKARLAKQDCPDRRRKTALTAFRVTSLRGANRKRSSLENSAEHIADRCGDRPKSERPGQSRDHKVWIDASHFARAGVSIGGPQSLPKFGGAAEAVRAADLNFSQLSGAAMSC